MVAPWTLGSLVTRSEISVVDADDRSESEPKSLSL